MYKRQSLSWENGEIVLWVYDGVAQGGEVLCGGRRLTLTLSRNGDAETMLTLAALDLSLIHIYK